METAVTKPASSLRKRPGFLRRLLERPRQLWLRKVFFQVHLWAGVLLALYVIAIGISGSMLVFKEELMSKPRVHIGALDFNACTASQLLRAMELADSAVPNMSTFLVSCPTPANGLFTVTVREAVKRSPGVREGRDAGRPGQRTRPAQRTVYIHPETWKVVGTADREASWLEWVEQFHVNLQLGRNGRLWNGIGASVLLAISLTGFALWWPGIHTWMRSLTIDPRRGWKRINWDLHNALGFWTMFFTLTWALTGMYFTWPKLFTTPIQKISAITTASYPAQQLRDATKSAPTIDAPLDVAGMIAEAQRQSPEGHLEGIFYGMGPRPVFTIYMARGVMGDYSNADFVYFDQRSNTLLYTWHRGQNHTLGDWAVWLIAPLHFGTTWGQDSRLCGHCLGWHCLCLRLRASSCIGIVGLANAGRCDKAGVVCREDRAVLLCGSRKAGRPISGTVLPCCFSLNSFLEHKPLCNRLW